MKLRLTCLFAILIIGQALAAANLTGAWSGEIEFTAPDGTVQNQSAYLDLKQEGNQVTGTGGSQPGEGLPLENVAFDGTKLTFSVTGPDGRAYKSDLTLVSADRLEGKLSFDAPDGTQASAKVTLDRQPAK